MGNKGFCWKKDESGATAVEFALVAAPLVFLIMGIVEIALMFTASSLLEGATATSARMIRTGQIQQSVGNQEQIFSDALCDHAGVFLDCDNIYYEVTPIADNDYDNATGFPAPTFDANGILQPVGFNTGGVSDVMLVRVTYRFPITTPLMQPIFSDGPNNTKLLMSTAVFKTEPYEFEEDE